jgi:hypothetical protein
VGSLLMGGQNPPQIAAGGNQAALFTWESADASVLCMYLPRLDIGAACPGAAPGAMNGTLNGVLCFNTATCEACAYDKCLPGATAATIGDLVAAPGTSDDCSSCHLAAPVLPLKPIFTPASPSFAPLQNLCIDKGGPTWVQAATWLKPDKTKTFATPNSCTKSCHDGFRPAPPGNYCSTIVNTAFGPGGAMQGKFATAADCNAFMTSVGCPKGNKAMGAFCCGAADCTSAMCTNNVCQ